MYSVLFKTSFALFQIILPPETLYVVFLHVMSFCDSFCPFSVPSGEWAWRLFEASVPLNRVKGQTEVELVCKAVDTSMNQQPDNADGIWNMMGLVHNAWHRITVKLDENDE